MRAAIWGSVVLLTGTLALGQDFPQPGPEHKRLQELVGDWDAVMKMGGQESRATAVYGSICGGMWVESDFEGDLGGAKFQGHGLDGYDLREKEYVGVWVDSMGGPPLSFRGKYDAKTKALVMAGESVGPDGKPQKFRTTTKWADKDHFMFTMSMVGPDGAAEEAFVIEYTRRK